MRFLKERAADIFFFASRQLYNQLLSERNRIDWDLFLELIICVTYIKLDAASSQLLEDQASPAATDRSSW